MRQRPTRLPSLWLISDARNDAALETALARLPRGSGLVFRHYHLPEAGRRARFGVLARLARRHGPHVVLAGSEAQARRWGADGAYGAPRVLGRRKGGLRLAAAHSLTELRRAGGVDAVLLSPVFPTRSHPGAKGLGAVRFRLLAARSPVPVAALGGMDGARARRLKWPAWAAIDAFCDKATRRIP